jgi:hypothetical protein
MKPEEDIFEEDDDDLVDREIPPGEVECSSCGSLVSNASILHCNLCGETNICTDCYEEEHSHDFDDLVGAEDR